VSRKRGPDEPPKKKPTPEDPLKHRGLAGLKAARDAMEAEAKAEEARRAEQGRPAQPPPKPRATTPSAPAKRPSNEVWRPDMDKALFAVAMSGVKPLAGKERGTRVSATPGSRVPGTRDSSSKMRRAQAEGDDVIAVRWHEDGSCEAARKGRLFALEALGRFASPEETLDLHRLEPVEARARVEEFVRTRRARGRRVVAVVHGVGRHAPDGHSVLRDVVVKALSEPPGSREVDAFRSGEGGAVGTIVVALRNR
jgi:DNA-nicking Smr family endonuclease